MMKSLASYSQTASRVSLLLMIILGLLSIQASYLPGLSSAATDTPTPTETGIRIDGGQGGFCGNNKPKISIQLQSIIANATRRVTGVMCGRLVFIKDARKIGKKFSNPQPDRLAILPCKGGGPIIFKTRPRELLDYYQFVNLKVGSGKAVYTEEYGKVTRYITSFETYYPLNNCGECGIVGLSYVPYSTAQVIFPGTAPASTIASAPGLAPFATLSQGGGGSALIFPSATPTASPTITPTLTSAAAALSLAQPAYSPTETPTPSPVMVVSTPTSSPTNPQPTASPLAMSAVSAGQPGPGAQPQPARIKIPGDQPFSGFLSYSLFTFLLVPLIVLLVIWKRARLL